MAATCEVESCEFDAHCRGWCKSHYQRWLLNGDVRADVPIFQRRNSRRLKKCDTRRCPRQEVARGLCTPCYCKWYRSAGDDPNGTRRGCLVDDCNGLHHAHGYCRRHWGSVKRTGDPFSGLKKSAIEGCSFEGCDNDHKAFGFCSVHAYRFKRYGDPSVRRPRGAVPRLDIPQEIRTLASGYHWAKRSGRQPTPEQHAGLLQYQMLQRALLRKRKQLA